MENKNKRILHSQCKECQKEAKNAWYKRNTQKHIANTSRNRNIYVKTARSYILNYLLTHPCVDCGEKDLCTLDFDHVRGKKDKAISQAARAGWRLERIKKEIEKCDVRCSNCHRRKTAKEQEWYKDWEILVEEKNKHSVPW